MKMTPLIVALLVAIVTAPAIVAQEAESENENNQQTEEETAENGENLPTEAELAGGADGAVLLRSVDTTDWQIVSVAGEGATSAVGGSMIRLRQGGRYHLDLRAVDSEVLPVDIRSTTGSVLISQREGVGASEMDGVDIEVSDDGITFTLTEELAEQIATVRAAPYPSMISFLSVSSPDQAEETEGEEEAGAEGEEDS
ncbi:MAG: hypothetical protein ACLFP6_09860 [Spirochaetaceae bacterium]